MANDNRRKCANPNHPGPDKRFRAKRRDQKTCSDRCRQALRRHNLKLQAEATEAANWRQVQGWMAAIALRKAAQDGSGMVSYAGVGDDSDLLPDTEPTVVVLPRGVRLPTPANPPITPLDRGRR